VDRIRGIDRYLERLADGLDPGGEYDRQAEPSNRGRRFARSRGSKGRRRRRERPERWPTPVVSRSRTCPRR